MSHRSEYRMWIPVPSTDYESQFALETAVGDTTPSHSGRSITRRAALVRPDSLAEARGDRRYGRVPLVRIRSPLRNGLTVSIRVRFLGARCRQAIGRHDDSWFASDRRRDGENAPSAVMSPAAAVVARVPDTAIVSVCRLRFRLQRSARRQRQRYHRLRLGGQLTR